MSCVGDVMLIERLLGLGLQVGIFNCETRRKTNGAKQLGVISRRAAVGGSVPTDPEEGDFVAFVGLVPVKVQRSSFRDGGIGEGDLLKPSGLNDGCAVVVRDPRMCWAKRQWETQKVHRPPPPSTA